MKSTPDHGNYYTGGMKDSTTCAVINQLWAWLFFLSYFLLSLPLYVGILTCMSHILVFDMVFHQRAWAKLMWLGLTNRMVDDSDSKPADFDRRFRSDSRSNDVFEIQRRIQIDDRDFDIKLIKFDLFSIKIDLFRYIFN